MKRPTHSDLIDLALDRLAPARREALEQALREDPALARRQERISAHLARYEALTEAPAPPPFDQLLARMDDRERLRPRAPTGILRPALALGAVAALVVIVAVVASRLVPGNGEPGAAATFGQAGPGVEIWREERRLEGPAMALAPGDRLQAAVPAEAHLGERVRLVLDAGAQLEVHSIERVRLERGRVYVEVAPGPFAVATVFGEVHVTGTAFEVSVDEGLRVRVEEGSVRVGTQAAIGGDALVGGTIEPLRGDIGAWFRRPRLRLELPARLASGQTARVEAVFENPGMVPVILAGPDAVRTAFWLEVEGSGAAVRNLPLAPPADAARTLESGGVTRLGARETLRVPLRLTRGIDEAGVYRCRAMYRPEDRPPVISGVVLVEVR